MDDKEYTAEELCRQYMGRAKAEIVLASQRIKMKEAAINSLRRAQADISMALFQIGRVFEQDLINEQQD